MLYASKNPHRGLSLIEVIVSFVVLGFIASAIGMWIVNNERTQQRELARNQATYKAQRIMDSLNVLGRGTMAAGDRIAVPCASAADTKAYACTTSRWAMDSANGLRLGYKVQVKVSWKQGNYDMDEVVEGVTQ